MSETPTKAWKLVATGRCSGHLPHSPLTCTDCRSTSLGLGASTGHSPLAQILKDVPDRPPHHQFPGIVGGSSCKVLFSLSSVLVTFHRNCPTSLLPWAQRPLCGRDSRGSLPGTFFPPPGSRSHSFPSSTSECQFRAPPGSLFGASFPHTDQNGPFCHPPPHHPLF